MNYIDAETPSGTVSFSHAAYTDAIARYSLQDMVEVVEATESGLILGKDLVVFFRDFAVVQAEIHPDTDRGIGIGSLAMRIDIACSITSAEEFEAQGVNVDGAIREFELAFGDDKQ